MILNQKETNIIFNKFLPLGKIPLLSSDTTNLSFTQTSTRRFIFDGWFVKKRGKSIKLSDPKKFNDRYLSFSFFESLSVLVQEDYNLYKNLFKFFETVDYYGSNIISSCSQTVIIFSHNSFGERLFPHIHQDDEQGPTLSLFFNLTNTDTEKPKLVLLDILDKDSKIYNSGYTDHKVLLVHERKSKSTKEVEITNNTGVLFDASAIPHWFSYTNDLWVTVVYDNVSLIADSVDYKDQCSVFSIKL